MIRQFKIGDFLKRIKNQIDINDSVKYKRVTVSGNHNGVSLRDEVLGSAIGTKKQFNIKGGNFILSKIDARNGAFGIIPQELDNAIITGNFWTYSVDTKLIDIEWFFYFTHSYNFIQICIESSTGSTHRKYMDEKVFLNHKIVLPEIDEQKEMVKKYKTSSKISNNLTFEIQTQKQLLSQLKKSILQEAAQGKLTADWRVQNPNTEPTSELLKRIKAEKAQLIKDKKIRKGKRQLSNDLGDFKLDIPKGWEYPELDDITIYITDGTHQTPSYTESGRMFLSAQNIKPFQFMPEKHRFVSEEAYQGYIANRKTEKGDLLLGRVGAGIGETAVVDQDLDFAIYVSLGLVKTFKQETDPNYLAIVFNSPYGNKYAKGNVSSEGGSAGNFNLGRIRTFPIPFPPLEEQKAIVEKVELLMQKCQALEEQIKTSEVHAQMLMQAVLKEAFEGKQEVVAL